MKWGRGVERASRLMQWQRQWFGDGNYGNVRCPGCLEHGVQERSLVPLGSDHKGLGCQIAVPILASPLLRDLSKECPDGVASQGQNYRDP